MALPAKGSFEIYTLSKPEIEQLHDALMRYNSGEVPSEDETDPETIKTLEMVELMLSTGVEASIVFATEAFD